VEHCCTKEIVKNEQNDEILQDSKIYKAFAKNLLEKRGKINILNIVKGCKFLHRKLF
jgi:hypothetical protein